MTLQKAKPGGPILLAIETSTPAGGTALWRDGGVRAILEGENATTHSERLLPAIKSVLQEAGCALADLDALVVSIGPGSFTGLRIGLTVAKALAVAAEKPIVAVSTLEALAWRFAEAGKLAAPMLDARRGEVFGALFRRERPGGPVARLTTDVAERPEVFAARIEGRCVAGGPGARRYAKVFAEALGGRFYLAPAELSFVSPGTVAALGAERFTRGEFANPLTLEPVYVRRSDAELVRDRRNVSR